MADIALLGIRVEFNGGRVAVTGLKDIEVAGTKVEAAATRMNRRLGLAEIEARKMAVALDAASGSSGRLTGGMGGLAGALQAVAGVLAIREVIGLADAYTGLHARLGLVTTDLANLARVEGDLFAISQQTRTGLGANVELYASLARSTKALGLSQSDLLQVTKTVAESFVISGASASETNSAVRQLSQAFASGVLRGDEFNSIAENAPRLQQAVAASLHITIGELRAMAEQGKLTGGVIAKALIDQSREIEAEFDRMPTTVSGAMTRIHNSVLMAVGAINSAQGSTAGLASALTDIANAIPAVGHTVNAFFAGWALAATDAAISMERLKLAFTIDPKQAIAGIISAATGDLQTAFVAGASIANRDTSGTLTALQALRDQQARDLTALGTTAPGALGGGGPAAAAGPTKEQLAEAERIFKRSIEQRADEWNHFTREQQRTYKQTSEQTVKDFEDEQDRETAIALAQANEQTRNAKSAYREETEAAIREFKEQERYREQMHKDWLRMISDIVTRGLTSFDAFFDGIFRLSTRMLADMKAAGDDQTSPGKYKALQYGTTALGGAMAGYNIGALTTNRGVGVLGGAAAGALAGSAILPGIGTAIGALAGAAGGLLGASHAQEEAAEALRLAAEQFRAQADIYVAQSTGDAEATKVAQETARFKELASTLDRLYHDNAISFTEWFQRANELVTAFTTIIDAIHEAAAIAKQNAKEDLDVRTLRNKGLTKEADLQAKINADAREYAEAVKAGMDPAYLALLKWNQGMEEAATAMNKANSAALNMAEGYKLQAAIYAAMAPGGPRGGGGPVLGGPNDVRPSIPGNRPTVDGRPLVVQVVLPNGRVLGEVVLKEFGAPSTSGNLGAAFGGLVQRWTTLQ